MTLLLSFLAGGDASSRHDFSAGSGFALTKRKTHRFRYESSMRSVHLVQSFLQK